jgi:hypothetical protein
LAGAAPGAEDEDADCLPQPATRSVRASAPRESERQGSFMGIRRGVERIPE